MSIGQTSSSMKTASRESIIAANLLSMAWFSRRITAKVDCLVMARKVRNHTARKKISSAPSVDTAASRARYLIWKDSTTGQG